MHHHEAFEVILAMAEARYEQITCQLSPEENERIQEAFDIIEELAEVEEKDYVQNYN